MVGQAGATVKITDETQVGTGQPVMGFGMDVELVIVGVTDGQVGTLVGTCVMVVGTVTVVVDTLESTVEVVIGIVVKHVVYSKFVN